MNKRMQKRPALFLDRDGTLVHSVHYPSKPQDLRLYAGLGPGLRALQKQGFLLVMVTNQAGIARGYFTEADLQCMHDYMKLELARLAVHLDGIYHCPHHPDGVVAGLSIHCSCRKPQPGMLLRAADELSIDLEQSWFVGDFISDIEAGNRAGCHTVLVDLGTEHVPTQFLHIPTFVARSTRHALQIISTVVQQQEETDLLYQPASWRVAKPIIHEGIVRVG